MSDRAPPAIGPMDDRIAIIGAGHVGATTAYTLMLRALFREIILVDDDGGLAAAEAEDLSDANVLARPSVIRAGTFADAATAGIAVLTAGAATHGDESRLSVAGRSAAIVRECATELVSAGFRGILIVAANPVDIMTSVALRTSAIPPARVIGTGTLLDSLRLRQAIATRIGVTPASIDATILGEHGDSSVAALSTIRIGGLSLASFARDRPGPDMDLVGIAREVRQGAYRIIAGKGYTSFGVAVAIVRICEAIARDERAILPVSTLLDGPFGITGLCLSLPCVLGAEGVLRVLTPDLLPSEVDALHVSAATIRTTLEAIDGRS